jgi:hypothetical protein
MKILKIRRYNMLHMVIATHSPESCPMANKSLREKIGANNQRVPEVMKKYNVTSSGSWTFIGGHLIYMMVDAANAHVVNQMLIELGIMEWNTVVINPVVTMQEAMTMM